MGDGSAVKGKQILGNYPDSFTSSLALDSNRGRMIPTTSWDSVSKLKKQCQIAFIQRDGVYYTLIQSINHRCY